MYEKKMKFVEQPLGLAPDHETSDPDTIDKYYECVNLEQEVACLMLSSMSPDLQRTLEKYNAFDMMKELKTIYMGTLECIGYVMPNKLGVSLILNSLNKDYDQFIQNYNMHSIGKMLAELHAMLKLHDKGAKGKGKGKNKLAYASKPKIPPPPKRDNSSKGLYLPPLQGGWSLEEKLESKKLKHGALSLYMGNGMRAAVEAIGSFDLILPSGLIINEVENQLSKKIKAIRSDRGREYPSHKFFNHMKSCGIISQLTPPYTPQHNRVYDRRNQTLLNMIRSMMNLTTLLKSFWGYALETAAHILNMVPTKKVDRTPYEIWHGKAPKLSYLRV
ncbi:zinc finger, CCHC-type containing protein [Tanacetum coccineum]